MRVSLSQQFVFATVALTVAVLMAALLLARWSFERGFGAYVNALERYRLERVGDLLLEQYDESRGWASLSPREFVAAVRRAPGQAGGFRPPPGAEPRPGARPGGPPPRRPAPGSRPGAPQPFPNPRGVPTALFDVTGTFIAGSRVEELQTGSGPGESPLVYVLRADGEVVGELRSLPRRRLRLADESTFVRRQGIALLTIFAVALGLAVAMSMLLSRRLLAPLRQAHGALGDLASGDYAQRLESSRSDELGELMHDIDRLADTLDRNQSARRRWIADISHELRTPIAVLKGELEAMADGIRPFDGEQLDSLQAEVARLAKLVDDLYQLSLADLGGLRYEFRELDLAALVSGLLQEYERRISAAGLALQTHLEASLPLRGDPQRLEQLLRNLLENSLAYTDAPGTLVVNLAADRGWAHLSVEDSAPGVPAAQCEELFEPLQRQDASRSRRSAGAGLGLAIARAVVEAHGGKITAEPSDLGGLRVQVTLPAQRG